MSHTNEITEVRRLRRQSGLNQKEAASELGMPLRTFRAYDRGEREPPAGKMDHIRNVLGNGSGRRSFSLSEADEANIRRVTVRPAGAGPGKSTGGKEEIVLDRRLLDGSSIDVEGHEFVRVVGSSMEPVLTHGQIVLVEPCSKVHGDDVYVYWSSAEEGHIVALLSKTGDGIEVQKYGPKPRTIEYKHLDNHSYEDQNGCQLELHLVGRVLGAIGRPSRTIAQVNEAARHASLAA